MRHIFTAIVAAIEAAMIALAGIAVIAIPVLLVGIVTFSLEVDFLTLGEVVAAIWVFVHARHLHIELDEGTVLGFGIGAEPFALSLTLAPILLAIMTAVLAWRMGRRFATEFMTGVSAIAGGSAGFYGATALIAWFAGPFVDASLWLVAVAGAGWFLVPAWVGLFSRHTDRVSTGWFRLKVALEQAGAPKLGWRFETYIPRVVKLAVALLCAMIFVGAIAVTLALTISFVDIVSLTQSLQLDVIGSLVFFLGQLMYLPTLVIWAIAWLSGSGFALGEGSSLSPFDSLVGPLPGVPVLTALPEGSQTWGFLAVVVVVAAGFAVGALYGGLPEYQRPPLWGAGVIAVCAVLLTGLALAGAFALASGSLGPGRLHLVGPDVWVTAGLASAELAIGVLAGFSLRRSRPPSPADSSPRETPEFARLVSAPAPAPLPQPKRALVSESDDQDTVPLIDLTPSEDGEAGHGTEGGSPFPRLSRIANPDDDETQPWFRRAASPRKQRTPRAVQSREELSEEELLEQFSWDARPDDDSA